MSPEKIYSAAISQLELQLDDQTFTATLRDAVLLRFDDEGFHVQVSTGYGRDLCQHRIYKRIKRVFSDVSGEPCELSFYAKAADDSPHLFGKPDPDGAPDQASEPDQDDQTSDEEEDPDQNSDLDEWDLFAKIPFAIVDSLDASSGWLLVKYIRHIHRKNNILIRNVDQLEAMFGLSASSIKRHTKTLVDAGHLHVTPGRGRGSANEYRLIGPLAVAVCGVEVANRTALLIKLSKKKVGQIDPANDGKSVKLTQQSEEVGQIDPANDNKVGQIEPPIQMEKKETDEIKNTDKLNTFIHSKDETSGTVSEPDRVEDQKPVEEKVRDAKNRLADDDQPEPMYPALALWVRRWGEVTTSQRNQLMMLSERYSKPVLESAFKATAKAYDDKLIRYQDRLANFEVNCKTRSGNNLVAAAVAAAAGQ